MEGWGNEYKVVKLGIEFYKKVYIVFIIILLNFRGFIRDYFLGDCLNKFSYMDKIQGCLSFRILCDIFFLFSCVFMILEKKLFFLDF